MEFYITANRRPYKVTEDTIVRSNGTRFWIPGIVEREVSATNCKKWIKNGTLEKIKQTEKMTDYRFTRPADTLKTTTLYVYALLNHTAVKFSERTVTVRERAATYESLGGSLYNLQSTIKKTDLNEVIGLSDSRAYIISKQPLNDAKERLADAMAGVIQTNIDLLIAKKEEVLSLKNSESDYTNA